MPHLTWHPSVCFVAGAVAHAAYVDSAHTPSNFGKLRIITSPDHPDADQMFGAGFVEGYMTAERIMDHHHNLYTYFTGTLQVDLKKPMEWCVCVYVCLQFACVLVFVWHVCTRTCACVALSCKHGHVSVFVAHQCWCARTWQRSPPSDKQLTRMCKPICSSSAKARLAFTEVPLPLQQVNSLISKSPTLNPQDSQAGLLGARQSAGGSRQWW